MGKTDATAWQQLDDYLGRPFSDDLWSDHAYEQANLMIHQLTPAEFTALRSAWPHRPLNWQTRCASILPWASVPRQEVASVLLEMTQAPDDELAITAADTLREFDSAMVAAAMTVGTEGRLLEVARRTPGLSAGAIHRFLDALAPMRNTTTERIVQAVEQHPERWRCVTRESALSLPVPTLSRGRAGLAFFWYPVGGPLQNRVVRAPTHRVVADVRQSDDITFVPIRPTDLGFADAAGQPLGRPTIGGGVSPGGMKQVRGDFYQATDRIIALYARTVTSPDALPDEGELAEMTAYREAFRRLAVVVLLPAHRALSPHFFDWMGAVIGPEL